LILFGAYCLIRNDEPMKQYTKLRQPENYELSEKDLQGIKEYDLLLDHLTDVPSSEPLHKISIDEIGIYQQKIMISIEDFEDRNTHVPILCDINVSTDLTENRGIHMSRCIESIFTLAGQQWKSLDTFTAALATRVKERQETNTGSAEVTGIYFHKRTTPKSGLVSYDRLRLLSKATVSNNDARVKTGMQVYNMTACPCTKTFTKYSIVPGLQSLGLDLQQIKQILEITATGTHTQVGETTLLLDQENSDISHKDVYEVLDQSVHLIYELLKRPDEHAFVKAAITKPQFTEDVAREVAYNAYKRFNEKLSPNASLQVESLLQDSIHIHDVRTVIKKTFADLAFELHR
jgi:GTP cyclohydrolase-4